MVLLPLPVVVAWVYILSVYIWPKDEAVPRSRSAIIRAYCSTVSEGQAHPGATLSQGGHPSAAKLQDRAGATLALLGNDNPTLIIRDKKPGEDAFDHFPVEGDDGSGASSDAEEQGATNAVSPTLVTATGMQLHGTHNTQLRRPWKAPVLRDEDNRQQRRSLHLPGESLTGK
jgi:hypothetical protein